MIAIAGRAVRGCQLPRNFTGCCEPSGEGRALSCSQSFWRPGRSSRVAGLFNQFLQQTMDLVKLRLDFGGVL
jgi:hypothetical protein